MVSFGGVEGDRSTLAEVLGKKWVGNQARLLWPSGGGSQQARTVADGDESLYKDRVGNGTLVRRVVTATMAGVGWSKGLRSWEEIERLRGWDWSWERFLRAGLVVQHGHSLLAWGPGGMGMPLREVPSAEASWSLAGSWFGVVCDAVAV